MMKRKCCLPLFAALSIMALVAPEHALARAHPTRSQVSLAVAPSGPLAGHPVTLVVLNSPPDATSYQWHVRGRTLTTNSPRDTVQFASPGIHRVSISVIAGAATVGRTLTVIVGSAHATRPHRAAHRARGLRALQTAGAAVPGARIARPVTAHAASSDPTVTIADFQFSPATITVHVGDTVTWMNNGPSAHTATAKDGSFNTGVLQKGKSASHTFNTAGTFTYICSIHPFMHGTVVVLANTTSTTPTTTSTTPTTTTPSSTSSQATVPTLPMTGFALTGTVLAGLLLTGLGLILRRKLRA